MPVGPLGVKPATAQLLIALVKRSVVDAVIMHSGHLIPARNKVWADVVRLKVARALWLDSDIYAALDDLAAFLYRADRSFDSDVEPREAWIGAVCARRGGGWAMQASEDAAKYPLLMGLGLAYWDVPRMDAILGPPELAFQWVPPFGEDYAICAKVWDAGYRVSVDAMLPTEHDDVGSWAGGTPDGR